VDDSTYQALILGLNTFVFVIALTAAMSLMSTINRMVEYTKQSADTEVGGNLVEQYGDETIRTFTGAEVYAFYGQKLNGTLGDVNITVKTATSELDILNFGEGNGWGYLSETFVLKCKGENRFVFELQAD
jgi:hypothetical protein